jgi:hypothetical protein
MQEPTRPGFGEGRSEWNRTSEQIPAATCRGNGDGMQAKRTIRNTGSPSGDRGMDQLATRERPAGLTGMAERLVVPTKPGNSGGGKGALVEGGRKKRR